MRADPRIHELLELAQAEQTERARIEAQAGADIARIQAEQAELEHVEPVAVAITPFDAMTDSEQIALLKSLWGEL